MGRKEGKTKEERNEDQQEVTEEEREEEREVVKGKKTLDLNRMPPELAISVLRHLGATDLCLASCVWQQLASDNILCQGLCRSQWHYASIYESSAPIRYRNLFLQLDEGTLTFNSDAEQGMRYFISKGLVADSATEIAKFIHGTTSSPHVKNKMSKREFIRNTRGAVGAEVGRGLEEDLYGSLYDNIFLRGHIADEERPVDQDKQQFVPGYLALFL